MKIKIPEKFRQKLNGEYEAYINNMLVTYSPLYIDNKTEFFSDYTNHGAQHIEEVLLTSANLISDESYEFLNSKDIFVLIVSVLLHDVGMHITHEGVKKIFNIDYIECTVKFLDSKSWKSTWNDFLYEAKRFNENQLVDIFGDSNVEITEPDLNNLSDYDRKLYGEFFRRHHPRLAHEIANYGFPTKIGNDNILVPTEIEQEIIDLCGLVARSHGMNLRDTFEYLKEHHDDSWKNPYDIKVFFLMVVLRIADYIQIHSERASKVLIKTKRFSSPVSSQEWLKHGAIKDININTADPERIFVKAKPDNSKIFLELRKLFDDIQYEFDISWAILGEVYGKDEILKSLKIKFRRLTSNLDNLKKFEKTVEYIPEKIRFDADPELLKLLIGPLYGEDPKYGVRELLQNSVDAVKERSFVESDIEEKITIKLEEEVDSSNEYYLTISDNGVGMTKETIINFFFRAGASFRNSMLWKKSFIEGNEVKVEKTGRFGVGVLAAFLLGDEFELYSKHYKDEIGYSCKASLSTKQVELTKNNCDIGTFIKIKLNSKINNEFLRLMEFYKTRKKNDIFFLDNEKNQKLAWFNWYVMDSPVIEYSIDNNDLKDIFDFQKISVSSISDEPLKGWYKFQTKDFKSIHWTIDNEDQNYYHFRNSWKEREVSSLFCNGFKVIRGYKIPDYPWKRPIVSVFDGNARMPLSLSRDYLLNDRLPFENELIKSVCKKIIDTLLRTDFIKNGEYWVPKQNILKFYNKEVDLSEYIVVSGDKYTLMVPFIFESLGIDMFYQLWLKESQVTNFVFNTKKVFYQSRVLKNDPNYFYKHMLELPYGGSSYNEWFGLGENNRRNDIVSNDYILNDKLAYMSEKNRLTKTYRESYKKQLFNDRWVKIKTSARKDSDNNITLEEESLIKKEKTQKKNISLKPTLIDKNSLTNDYYYFIKEYNINQKSKRPFKKFKEVWGDIFGNDSFLIPIEKEYRIKL